MRLSLIILVLALPGVVSVRDTHNLGEINVHQESTCEKDPPSVPIYVQLVPDTEQTGGCGSGSWVAKGCCKMNGDLSTFCTLDKTKFAVGKLGTHETGFFNPAPVQHQSSQAWLTDVGAGKFTAYRGTIVDHGQTHKGYELASVRCVKGSKLTRVWPECSFKDASAQPCPSTENPAVIAREALDLALCESMRLRLQPQEWMKWGWSPTSKGFVHWIASAGPGVTKVVYGCAALGQQAALTPLCVDHDWSSTSVALDSEFQSRLGDRPKKVAEISHQYTTPSSDYGILSKGQQLLDYLVEYHSLLVIEWESEQLTVVELAWRNGNSGSKTQQSNFYPDRLVFPPEMVAPYASSLSEIRMYDMPEVHVGGYETKTISVFLHWMQTSEHGKARFMPKVRAGAAITMEERQVKLEVAESRAHLLAALLNYMNRGVDVRGDYKSTSRNCQTFSTDCYRWLTGTADFKPKSTSLFYTPYLNWFQP